MKKTWQLHITYVLYCNGSWIEETIKCFESEERPKINNELLNEIRESLKKDNYYAKIICWQWLDE